MALLVASVNRSQSGEKDRDEERYRGVGGVCQGTFQHDGGVNGVHGGNQNRRGTLDPVSEAQWGNRGNPSPSVGPVSVQPRLDVEQFAGPTKS